MCPLCLKKEFRFIKSISAHNLAQIYSKELNFNTYNYIDQNLDLLECAVCSLQTWFPIISSPSELYSHLQNFSWYYQEHKWEYDICKKLVDKDKTILEVGCGTGSFRLHIKSGSYTGLEFNPTLQDPEIHNQTIESHSLERAAYYDCAFSFQVLEHTTCALTFLQGLGHSVKCGGTIAISVPFNSSYLQYADGFALNLPPHHLTRWDIPSLLYAAKILNCNLESLHFNKFNSLDYETRFVNDPETHIGNSVLAIYRKL